MTRHGFSSLVSDHFVRSVRVFIG